MLEAKPPPRLLTGDHRTPPRNFPEVPRLGSLHLLAGPGPMLISPEAPSRRSPDPSTPPTETVATAGAAASRREPVQGHLLHNFSFPILKTWASQRVLRCANVNGKGEVIGGRRESEVAGRSRIRGLPAIGGGCGGEDSGLEEVREKLLVHLREAADRMNLVVPPRSPSPSPPPAPSKSGETNHQAEADVVAEAASARPWNLRKRRGSARAAMERYLIGGGTSPEKRTVRLRSEDAERRERPKFSITLTREEIEEDIYAVTGCKARRRPRKRPRVVQKQLDALFPGSWLSEITVNSYEVPEQR